MQGLALQADRVLFFDMGGIRQIRIVLSHAFDLHLFYVSVLLYNENVLKLKSPRASFHFTATSPLPKTTLSHCQQLHLFFASQGSIL